MNEPRSNPTRHPARLLRWPFALTSIRVRLTVWYIAVLALVLVLAGSAVYGVEAQSLSSALDARLHARAQQLAATYDAPHNRLVATPDAAVQSGDEIVLLLTPQSRIVQRQAAGALSSKAPWSTVLRDLHTVVAHGGARVVEEAMTVALPIGTAKDGRPETAMKSGLFRFTGLPLAGSALLVVGLTSDVPRQLAALIQALAIVIPLTLLICAGGGFWLADRALRPIREITRTAREIGSTDLGRRLDLRRRDELGDLAATIDGMLDRLEAAFARQHRFTADASHELRTPLAIIDLEATRALDRPRTQEEYRRAVRVMQQEAAQMARLVDGLLTLARADSGRVALHQEEIDMAEIALDVVERLTPLARRTGMTLTLAPLEELPLCGDRTYLTQMLANLVENALKHGAGVGTRVEIDAGRRREAGAGGVWLRVADDGPGIAPDAQPHLGERFYRVDSARTHTPTDSSSMTGSGLGLAIVQWIVQAHGGSLQLTSDVGQGAAFEVWLPLSQAIQAQDANEIALD